MDKKYLKPKSLTWWAALAPLIGGLALITEPLHGIPAVSDVVRAIFGPDVSGTALVNVGLAGIGLRGAMGSAGE